MSIIRSDASVHDILQGQPFVVRNLGPFWGPGDTASSGPSGAICDLHWADPVHFAGKSPGILFDPSGEGAAQLFTYDVVASRLTGMTVLVLFASSDVVEIDPLPLAGYGDLTKTQPPDFRPKYPIPSPD